ncbi:histidine phosphatase family protein [Patescibacteria group bacterium]
MIQNKFYIVRHGESENNLLEIDSSKLENKDQFGLTGKGKKETQTEAKKYKNFDIIISSPFRRAKETAMIFARTSQCEVVENDLLKEVCVGDFELCKYETSDAFFEKHSDESIPYPNGESLLDAKKRADEFLIQINQIHKNKSILLVTHGWIVLFLMEHLDKNFDRKKAIKNYDDNNSRKVFELKRPKKFTQ